MENFDLNILKKKYGEKFAKMCRILFPDFLEKKGFLSEVITSNFAESKMLYDDIKHNKLTQEFKNFVFRFLPTKEYTNPTNKNIDPYSLMKKAGYTLYKCETKEEVLQFKKYWEENEKLCTFRDDYRVDVNMVFFAVKQGAEKLNRSDFKNPVRQDEYGTSVISIQISKDLPNTISILNRYNHSVANPDAAFSNNLENIIEGLTSSFVNEFGLELDAEQKIIDWPNYVKATDGKLYRYIFEERYHKFCADNIFINPLGEVVKFNKDRYVLFDTFVLDTKENTIKNILPLMQESFETTVTDIVKTQIKKDGDEKQVVLTHKSGKDIIITLNKDNRIIKYHNPIIKHIPTFFENRNSVITELSLPNVERVESNSLKICNHLKTLSLPNAVYIGDNVLILNEKLESVYLPKLKSVGKSFLRRNHMIKELDLPNLQIVDTLFLFENQNLSKINAPKLKIAKSGFLFGNKGLTEISFPSLKIEEGHFISNNTTIERAYLPKLEIVGDLFLRNNLKLKELHLPKVAKAGERFLEKNKALKVLTAPKLKMVEEGFLENNQNIDKHNYKKAKDSYKSMR